MILYHPMSSGEVDFHFATYQEWFGRYDVDFKWVKDSQGRQDCVQAHWTILNDKRCLVVNFPPMHEHLATLFKLTWGGQ